MIILIYIVIFVSSISGEERGWVHPETGWELIIGTHMCIFMLNDIYIDNNSPQEDHADAIGIFYNNQCIGWEYYNSDIVIIPTIGDDGDNPHYPSTGDSISLFLYDDSEDIVLDLQSNEDIPLWTLNQWPSVSSLFACSHNIEINDEGECPSTCDYDPNIDGNIDLLDIILIINLWNG